MSEGQDVEAGLLVENIPLIGFTGTGCVDESNGVAPTDHDKAGDIHDEQHCIVDNMAEENLESNLEPADNSRTDEIFKLGAPKYQIDLIDEKEILDGNCDGLIQFMKMRANVDKEMVRKDVQKLCQIIQYEKFGYHDSIILVDNFDDIKQAGFDFFKELDNSTRDTIFFIANGFPYWVDSSGVPCNADALAILPTQSVIGNAVSASDYDKPYSGKLQIHNDLLHTPFQVSNGHVLLLEGASKQDLLQYKLACHNIRIDRMNCFCLKIIMYGNKDILKAIADGYYFDGNNFTVVVRNNTPLSSALWGFVNKLKENSKELGKAEEDLIMACQDIAKNERIDIAMIIQNIKHNIHSIFTCRSMRGTDLGLNNFSHFAISTAFLNEVSLITEQGMGVLKRFKTPDYASKGTILVFKNALGLSNILAKYLEDKIYEWDQLAKVWFFYDINAKNLKSFIESIDRSKLKVYDSSTADSYPESAPNRIFKLLKKAFAQIEKTWLFGFSCLDLSEYNDEVWFQIMDAIYSNEPLMLKELLVQKDVSFELNTYIVCNLVYHWSESDNRGERKVEEYFGILPRSDSVDFTRMHFASEIWEGKELHLGMYINNAIAQLSNGNIANCFLDDGSLNLENVSPIQALIINRIFCLQFDMVQVLLEHDRENVFVNAMLIWILIDGILREGIFSRERGTEELTEAKEHFSAAVVMFLDETGGFDADFNIALFTMIVPLFRNKPLYQVATDAEFFPFLSHIATRNFTSLLWLTQKVSRLNSIADVEKNCSCTWKANIIRTPRMKLYVHMAMHVISYVMLACYTLQASNKINAILKWALFIMILSLFMDEVRQALGENPFAIRSSLKRWWRDGWNRIDFLSMMVYFITFSLDCGGIKNASNLLYPAFSFIWCLKFYQFLRAFKSLGTYIILVQKMLPQLGNFVVVAMIAIISYGVFMTSILFPKIKFESWSMFIMILSRPYLLLFAETGINEYDLSAKNTIYNTPKIPTASEVFVIVGMCIFLMFGSVLLLNLLIAIFSGIYEDVYQKSEIIWALNDAQLLQEFQCKPDVPVPFSLPLNVYLIIKRLTKHNEHMTFNDCSLVHDSLMLKYLQTGFELKDVQKEKPTLESMINRIDNLEQYCKEALKSVNENVIDGESRIKAELQQIQELLQKLQDIKKD